MSQSPVWNLLVYFRQSHLQIGEKSLTLAIKHGQDLFCIRCNSQLKKCDGCKEFYICLVEIVLHLKLFNMNGLMY